MSMVRCERHQRTRDSDFQVDCPFCEDEAANADFAVIIRPGVNADIRTTGHINLWSHFVAKHKKLYSPEAFARVEEILRAGRSWVMFSLGGDAVTLTPHPEK